jgi:protein phosphatase
MAHSWDRLERKTAISVESAAATHIGRVREVNEDAYLALPDVVLVADGMGGHACGDVASALTVTAFEQLGSQRHLEPRDVAVAVSRANEAIVSEASQHPEKEGMGTTLSGIALVDQAGSPHWLVFNVGDSRVYQIVDGVARQMTVDHSEVAELIASGRMSPEAARRHPLRNVITRSLGTTPAPALDTWLSPVAKGDRFLVCSDGLTTEVADAEIAALVTESDSIAAAARALVGAAVSAGGRDNVTVIVVELSSQPDSLDDRASALTVPRAQIVKGQD